MNVAIVLITLFSTALVLGITFTIWKLMHLILEQQGIKYAKLIALFVCISSLALIAYWLKSPNHLN